jgi:putative peptidoglycan lipid II flippase
MPYMPLICIAALFTSAVNLSGRFGLAEIASSALNLCMIIGLGLFGLCLSDSAMGQARWLCAGAVAGGALQLLIPMWGLQQAGWKSHPIHADEKAWQALRLAFIPAALGAGILQINFLISRSLAFNVDGSRFNLLLHRKSNRRITDRTIFNFHCNCDVSGYGYSFLDKIIWIV